MSGIGKQELMYHSHSLFCYSPIMSVAIRALAFGGSKTWRMSLGVLDDMCDSRQRGTSAAVSKGY